MASTISLTAERRTGSGKGAARKLRQGGRVPGVIYGHGRPTEPLSLSGRELETALMGHASGSTLVDLTIDGSTLKTLIREVQRHPVRSAIMHIDFFEIHAGETIRVEIPILLEGLPDGVKNAGGVLDQIMRTLRIEVLPERMPEHIKVDVTHLTIGKSVHVGDIPPEGVTVLADPGDTVCTVVPPRVEEVVPTTGVPVEEVTEPELIRKPRGEEEGEEPGEGAEAEG